MKNRYLFALAGLALLAAIFFLWPGGGDEDESQTAGAAAKPLARASSGKPASDENQAPARVFGRVLDAGGQALTGAVVQLVPAADQKRRLSAHDATSRSGVDGEYELAEIPPGEYRLSASAPGFLPTRKSIHLQPGEERGEVLLQLEAGGQSLSGVVHDLTGGVVAEAIVQVVPMGSGAIQASEGTGALTDPQGRYTLNLANGRYLVWAFHADYVSQSKMIEMTGGPQELDLRLAPGAVVEGQVRRSDDGAVVPGARVSYATETASGFGLWANTAGSGSILADAAGRFRITGLNSGSLRLSARGDRSATSEPTRVALGIAEHHTDVTLYVEQAFQVRGRVVDSATREGVPGLRVSADSDGGSVTALADSDAEGHFQVDALPAGKYRLRADGGEYLRNYFGDSVLVEADVEDALIEVERGAMITGRVEPAVQAEVGIDLGSLDGLSPNAFTRSQSDMDGRFRIGPFAPASFRLQARTTDGKLGLADVSLPRTGLSDVVISLHEGASLAGRVIDASGAPVGGVAVSMRPDPGNRRVDIRVNGQDMIAQRSIASPDGSFLIAGLPADRYQLSVLDAQGQTMAWAGDGVRSAEPRIFDLDEQEHRTGELLRVEERDARIVGTVLGPDGSPAPDVWVTASTATRPPEGLPPAAQAVTPAGDEPAAKETHGSHMEMRMIVSEDENEGGGPALDLGRGGALPPVLTDEDGAFEITGLREGAYDLVAEGMKGAARAFLRGAATGEEARLRLQELTRVEGSVTLDDQPVTNFLVELSGLASRRKRVRDPEGGFALHRIDPGSYTVTVRSDKGEAEAQIAVVAGKSTEVALEMEPVVSVRGRVVDEEGAPVAGALIVASPQRDDGQMKIMMGNDSQATASDGSFEIGVRAGRYTLIVIEMGQGPMAFRPLDARASEGSIDLGTITGKPDGGPPMPGGE